MRPGALFFPAAVLLAMCGSVPAQAQNAPAPAPPAPATAAAPKTPASTGTSANKPASKAAHVRSAAKKQSAPVYHLLGFSLSGSKHIDGDALVATLPQKEGDVITAAEIQEDAKRIGEELNKRHVHGNMTTATLEQDGKGHNIWVIWDIHKMDALAYAPLKPPRHFVSQTFSGNTKLTADQLTAAIGLHPGDKMPDGSISDARTGIEQAYDKVMPGAAVQVKGKVIVKKDGSVLVDWVITEPK